ncbi:hypothetical protein Tco_0993860, partial [Tanacetum coccineum]
FWNTATSKTFNSVKQIHAIVDGKAVVITESSVRNDILFDDEDGITCFINDEIFENLALMSVERAITTDASLVATHDSDNIIRTQTTTMPNVDIPQGMDTGGRPMRQETMGVLLLRLVLRECLNSPMNHLSQKVLDMEKENDAQAVEILKLKKRGRTSDKTKPMCKDSDFDDLNDLVDKGMAFIQEKDAENQGKIGADDTEVVKESGDTEAGNTTGEGVSTIAPRTPPTTKVLDDQNVTMAMA